MEKVLVIPKSCLPEPLLESRIYPVSETWVSDLVVNQGQFLERELAETRFDYYQLIPYVVIKREKQLFCTARTKKQTETRLHDKLSIGVGGHLNPSDGDLSEIVVSGMARELEEELYPFSKTKPSFQGLLIDYATEVSLVHLGLVYFVETSDEVMVKETGKMRGQWLSLAELTKPDVYSKLETWSQIVIDYIKKD